MREKKCDKEPSPDTHMFQKLILKCDFKGEARPSYNWGSLMHGVLMEILPDDTVNSLERDRGRFSVTMREKKCDKEPSPDTHRYEGTETL